MLNFINNMLGGLISNNKKPCQKEIDNYTNCLAEYRESPFEQIIYCKELLITLNTCFSKNNPDHLNFEKAAKDFQKTVSENQNHQASSYSNKLKDLLALSY